MSVEMRDMKQSAGIDIRPAVEADLPLIHEFICELAEYEKLRHEVVATEESLRRSLFGAGRSAEVVFASLDGEKVGFALFFHNYSTFLGRPGLYLEDLFVRKRARGHSVGRKLLAYLAALAVERGCGRLEWLVLDWNEPAIGFYERIGARPVEGFTVYRATGEALERLAGEI
ncbi:MAG: GNAT family N-acetyltransferase [Gammaproteobacteria bacterium]